MNATVAMATERTTSGLRDFDFLVGRWRVHHRRLKERLAGNHEWIEFEGTSDALKVMGGYGLVDDNTLELPLGPYRAPRLARGGSTEDQFSDGPPRRSRRSR